MLSNNNIWRVFDRVISIDAWHSDFDPEKSSASVHVDLSFLQATMGEESSSPVRFHVSLKKAKLTFIVPENEPIAVIQRSVARETPMKGSITHSSIEKNETSAGLSGALNLSSNPSFSAKIDGSVSVSDNSIATVNISGEVSQFAVRQFNSNGRYCWDISPLSNVKLSGKVWNPVEEPRLSIKKTAISKIDPTCRFQVSCKREDIVIDKIELKNRSALKDRFKDNRNAAAAAFLRKVLSEHGLESENFDENFSDIMMADMLVQKEIL